MAPTFRTFRDGLGGDVCRRCGHDISDYKTWRQFTTAVAARNDAADGEFVKAAFRFAEVASTGEWAVLVATLGAGNFARQADELGGKGYWQAVNGLGSNARESIAACVLRVDA